MPPRPQHPLHHHPRISPPAASSGQPWRARQRQGLTVSLSIPAWPVLGGDAKACLGRGYKEGSATRWLLPCLGVRWLWGAGP